MTERGKGRGARRVPLRVLIVEDSEDDTLLLLRALERGGYDPLYERVDTAEAMLAALEDKDWDVVISDHAMPSFSAPAALKLLRENEWPDLPFLIVSGHIGEDAAVEIMKAGAHDYVAKDSLARLAPAIERELRDAEERRQRRRAQEALRLAEEKYRGIFENAVEGIYQTTVEGRFVTANPAMARIFGYDSPEEMIRTVHDLAKQHYVEPDRRAEFARRMQQDGRVLGFEVQVYRKDGSVIWISTNARVVRDASGEVVGYEGTLEDFTERRRAEEELRTSRNQLEIVLQGVDDGITAHTASGQLVYANAAGARIAGYPSARTLLEASSQEMMQKFNVRDEAGRPFPLDQLPGRRVSRGESGSETLLRFYMVDTGEERWAIVKATPVFDEHGQINQVVNIFRDFTERKRAEDALRQSEELYRTVVEQAAENIFLLDTEDKRIIEANSTLHRSLGYAAEEIRSMTLYDVVAHDRESIDRNVRRVAEEGRTFLGERKYRRKDGSMMDVEVNASAIHYGGREVQCVVAHDITERKKAEEGLRRSLDRLVALHEAGHILGSTLEPEEVGTRLLEIMRRISGLTTAVISLRNENERLDVWRSIGLESLGPKTRYAPEVKEALEAALEREAPQVFATAASGTKPIVGLCLPLRVRERSLGVLEVYGPEALAEQDTIAILESLANQAASALENARLYEELAERERRLQELVGKILAAQEEERRRVAYEVHDGLAQVAAAAHQHLQAFAQYHSPASREGREDLDRVSKLVRQTVGEARRIIADLRPTALDDLGLEAAVRIQLEALRAEGWRIGYQSNLDDERLPVSVETALFRVAQEALNNAVKHARTRQANLTLERLHDPRETVRLSVRDHGAGFSPDAPENTSGPGERVGLSGMRERVALLGGDFRVASRPGAGTLVVAEVPLWEPAEDNAHGS